MKQKTSITLSADLLKAIDRLTGKSGNRSALIEKVLRDFVAAHARRERDERDRRIIDAAADRLNEEAADALGYQMDF
jgi:metal-responsive CopG/Arc/MetJ family transcriptional regulator